MKKVIVTAIGFFLISSLSAVEIVPLKVKYGMWKNDLTDKLAATFTQENNPMTAALAKIEESAKANPQMAKHLEKYKEMMKNQKKAMTAATKGSCLNEETLQQGIDKVINQKKGDKCTNKVEKSTATFLKGKTTCKGKTHSYQLNVTDPKTIQVKIKIDNSEGLKDLDFKMYWASSKCS